MDTAKLKTISLDEAKMISASNRAIDDPTFKGHTPRPNIFLRVHNGNIVGSYSTINRARQNMSKGINIVYNPTGKMSDMRLVRMEKSKPRTNGFGGQMPKKNGWPYVK